MGVSLVLTPSTRSQRQRLTRHLVLFLVAALPVALVLGLIVNWWLALAYTVVQTGGLMFGVGQQPTSTLKVDASGLQYEAGPFVLRSSWTDVERIAEATLPSGPTQAFVLRRSGLRWAHSADTRAEVTSKGWDRVIPIDAFESSWPDGPLGDAVRTHRPELLR